MSHSNSSVDPRARHYVLPERIVWETPGSAAPLNSGHLLDAAGGPCALKYSTAAPGLLVDFGRELHGGIQIENGITPDHAPARIRVRFGESVSEAMGAPNNDHAIHDYVCTVPWYGTMEIGNTGFRFVRIDLLDPGAQLEIQKLRAVFLFRDIEYKGRFHCSDPLLNQIWQTGAYTVHLCMQDLLWDGIKRDRLVWLGDMHPETTVISAVFGEQEIVPQSLDFVRDQTPLPRGSGMIPDLPGWMNGISSYSLWWILIQRDWYFHHGNRAYLEAQRDYLCGILDVLQGQIGDDNAEQLGEARFLDWPSSGDARAVHAGLHALLTMAFKAGAELCAVLGEEAVRDRCLAAVTRLKWHRPPATPSKQANALLALSGLADPGDTNQRVLAVDPLRGVSTFYGYYVLQARALAGDYAGCLELIRQFWGKMLELGATTFWEDFNLEWAANATRLDQITPEGKSDIHADFGDYCYKGLRHSLCHGWAAGPTAWLTEHVLGIRPRSPGCGEIAIEPHLGDLEFAGGSFPTPLGIVEVEHRKTPRGEMKTEYSVPPGIRISG